MQLIVSLRIEDVKRTHVYGIAVIPGAIARRIFDNQCIRTREASLA